MQNPYMAPALYLGASIATISMAGTVKNGDVLT
jgi:hypothetical protein